jgi:hypothetical protein
VFLFFGEAIFFLLLATAAAGGFGGADCPAQTTAEIIVSTHAVAIIRLMAGSASRSIVRF